MITSCNIFPIFARKQIRVTDQRVRIKIWQNFVNLLKIFGSSIFQFCSYRSQRTFLKKSVWNRKNSWFWQKNFFFSTLFQGYLKNHVTTVHLLQCKTTFFIHLCFCERNLVQIKEHQTWDTYVNIKKSFFWFVYTCLHSFTLV